MKQKFKPVRPTPNHKQRHQLSLVRPLLLFAVFSLIIVFALCSAGVNFFHAVLLTVGIWVFWIAAAVAALWAMRKDEEQARK